MSDHSSSDDDGAFFFGGGHGAGGLQAMGILNALRTGDPTLDMILAMCLPIVLRFVFDIIKNFEHLWSYEYWFNLFFSSKDPTMHYRTITYRTQRNGYGGVTNLDEDSQNKILQKSIQLYIHSELRLKLQEADTVLTSMEGKNALSGRSYCYYDDDDSDVDDSDDDSHGGGRSSSRTVVGILSKYDLVQNPPKEQWHDLGLWPCTCTSSSNTKNSTESTVNGDDCTSSASGPKASVQLKMSLLEEDEGGNGSGNSSSRKSTNITFYFKSTDGSAIDHFITAAYQWYLAQLKKMEDHSRYFYELKGLTLGGGGRRGGDDDGDGGGSDGRTYKRYRLSDEKTFDSLFFEQKESLLTLIDHFRKRTGKYRIKGYPHKLGVLLHGPPGSGKTSLIKALAHYTKRSVINVSLARISTNAELMSIFFDKNLRVEGEYVSVKLRFKDVIFVIEDVDAASKIVKRRDGKKIVKKTTSSKDDAFMHLDSSFFSTSKSPWQMILESQDDNCKELVQVLMEKSERLKEEATKPCVMQPAAQQLAALAPGLGIVGDTTLMGNKDPALQRLQEEAISSAEKSIEHGSAVDQYLGKQAETLKRMLDSGCPVDEKLENILLGIDAPDPLFSCSNQQESDECSDYVDDDDSCNFVEEPDSPLTATRTSNAPMPSGNANNTSVTREGGNKKLLGPSLWAGIDFDELNLQGLLNVLDGVVDTPGRIVIMTTNHPEHLDPALIRPGRIDKKLYLGYMRTLDMIHMLEHYFEVELTEEQRSRVERAVAGDVGDTSPRGGGGRSRPRPPLKLTPAQVEQMTAEYETVDEMIAALEKKGGISVPSSFRVDTDALVGTTRSDQEHNLETMSTLSTVSSSTGTDQQQ